MTRPVTLVRRLLPVLLAVLAPLLALAQVLPGTFAAGGGHSLAIHADGTLWATGDNGYGQLGTGGTGSTTAWVQVAAGGSHSLGLRADGTLYAWGRNGYGQLGTATNSGTTTPNPTPTQVAGTYTQVAAGQSHSLGLRADGTLWSWGYNYYGQLGNATSNGTETANPTPTQVAGTYTQVAAGGNHSLGLRADGSLYAWGYNQRGQLGIAANSGTTTPNPAPAQVAGTYTQVAAGLSHSLGLRADGSLWAWGNNYYGQLGTTTNSGTFTTSPTPVQVAGTYVQAAAGSNYSLGLRADGSLWAWGYNYYGQLGTSTGNGTNNANPTPAATGTALPTRSTASGANFGLAVRADGTLWAWGYNGYGQFGDGSTTASPTPRQVGTARDWVQVATGRYHSLGLKADGSLWAWGYNAYGQLGTTTNSGTTTPNPTPVQVAGTYTQVAASLYFSLGLRADGSLYAWGANSSGQLGNATNNGNSTPNPTPSQVAGTYTQVSAGYYHSLGLRADGSLYAWGSNAVGQLGTTTNSGIEVANPTPSQVAGTYTQVAAGYYHSLGLKADGTLYAWGSNNYGQLGRGSINTTDNPTPTQEATGGTGWTTLAPGSTSNSSLARTASGLNFASAGQNDYGQLGDGTQNKATRFDRDSPLADLQPLPVQLVAFTARPAGPAAVQLAWTTASEAHSAYFAVERSPDGQQWQALGRVAAAGTSASPRAYGYLDEAAPAGTSYYRLRQVDADGRSAYSPVYPVTLGVAGLALYPNPAPGGLATLTGAAPNQAVQVLDALGRLAATATADATGTAWLGKLAPGLYLVRAGTGSVRLAVE